MKFLVPALLVLTALPAQAEVGLTLTLAQDAEVSSQSYSCAGGAPFTVRYVNAGANALALLPVDGEERIFVNVVSGSGARYASGQYVWWSKGDTATLEDEMKDASLVDCVSVE